MGDSKVKLTGRLLQHARMTVSAAGEAFLTVQIGQSQGATAAIAVHSYGNTAAAQQAAATAARTLRAGALVCVHAHGWALDRRGLHLVCVELIEQLEHFYPNEAAEPRLNAA